MRKKRIFLILPFFLMSCSDSENPAEPIEESTGAEAIKPIENITNTEDGLFSNQYRIEKFTLGPSLEYSLPVTDVSGNMVNEMDYSSEEMLITSLSTTHIYNESDNYLSDLTVGYDLYHLNEEDVPFEIITYENLNILHASDEEATVETIDINGQEWYFVKSPVSTFDVEGSDMTTETHTYVSRHNFEYYTFSFNLLSNTDSFENQEVLENTYNMITEIINLVEFSREATMTEVEILEKITGTWDVEGDAAIVIENEAFTWYLTELGDESDVLYMDILEIEPILHPEEELEYANLHMHFYKDVLDGVEENPDDYFAYFISFDGEPTLSVVDFEFGELYQLNPIE